VLKGDLLDVLPISSMAISLYFDMIWVSCHGTPRARSGWGPTKIINAPFLHLCSFMWGKSHKPDNLCIFGYVGSGECAQARIWETTQNFKGPFVELCDLLNEYCLLLEVCLLVCCTGTFFNHFWYFCGRIFSDNNGFNPQL
jgi:hypothetical protein